MQIKNETKQSRENTRKGAKQDKGLPLLTSFRGRQMQCFSSEASGSQLPQEKEQLAFGVITTADTNALLHSSSLGIRQEDSLTSKFPRLVVGRPVQASNSGAAKVRLLAGLTGLFLPDPPWLTDNSLQVLTSSPALNIPDVSFLAITPSVPFNFQSAFPCCPTVPE